MSRPVPPTHAWPHRLAGRLEQHSLHSPALEGNPLGDPAERPVHVYLPAAYDAEPARRFPVVVVIQGYTGALPMWHNRQPWQPTLIEAVDADVAAGRTAPVLLVLVDAWTAYGGSQYVDSPGTGRYHSYLCDDVVPWVDAHYRTLPDAAHRGIAGKSSGGFGAMITPMLRPDLFGALASHAGDSLYELCYLPEVPVCVRALRAWDGDLAAWWRHFCEEPSLQDPATGPLVTAWGVSACFSPDPDGTPVPPWDTRTGVLDDERWARWLAWDPVRMVPAHAEALRGMRGIWLDSGTQDEYHLDLGATAVHAALEAHGVTSGRTDVRLELVPGRHGHLAPRYPLAISWMAGLLAP